MLLAWLHNIYDVIKQYLSASVSVNSCGTFSPHWFGAISNTSQLHWNTIALKQVILMAEAWIESITYDASNLMMAYLSGTTYIQLITDKISPTQFEMAIAYLDCYYSRI